MTAHQPANEAPRDTDPDVFDRHMTAWRSWQQEPWGRMRYSVAWYVLQRHVPALGEALRVVDVGGGDGTEALRLAALGHEVTIVDSSQAMLAEATRGAEALGVADRVTVVPSSVDDMSDLPAGSFDLALCHFVIGYVARPSTVIGQMSDLLRPDGLCSLIAANPASDVIAKAVRGLDFSGAEDMICASHMRAVTFDHDVTRISPTDGEALVIAAGLDVVHRYGGRIVLDLIVDDSVKYDPDGFAAIESLEHRLCAEAPYRDIGRFWQIIARRSR